jgi:hypothetical protein
MSVFPLLVIVHALAATVLTGGLSTVALIRCDEPDATMAVLMVAPLYKYRSQAQASSTLWKVLRG